MTKFGGVLAAVLTAISVLGYTVNAQVSGRIAQTIQAEYHTSLQGGAFDPPEDKTPRIAVRDLNSGDWIGYDEIAFLDGEYDSLYFHYWWSWPMDGSGAVVKFRIDSPTGTVIAQVDNLPSTPQLGYEVSEVMAAALTTRPQGVHPFYITIEGSGGGEGMLHVDKVVLAGTMTANPDDAKTYHVATDGDDANNGLSVDTPFRTIQKAASIMKAGSRCLIREGIYRETVTPAYTGIAGAPLSFEAYNNENVVINGAEPVESWSVHSGSIYKADMSWTMGAYKDQVLIDGEMAWAARTPNVDEDYNPHPYLNWCGTGVYNWKPWQEVFEPIAVPQSVCFGDNGSLWPADQSTGSPFDMSVSQSDFSENLIPLTLLDQPTDFFKGGLITVRNYYWASIGEITGSRSESPTKTVIDGIKSNSMWRDYGGPGFISYVYDLLDTPNEWFRDENGTLYLWAPGGGNPQLHLVEAKKRILGFDLRSKSYVNITGLRFMATSMTLGDATNCVVDNCHFKHVSHYDTFDWFDVASGFFNSPFDPSSGYTGIYVSGEDNVVQNSSVIGSAGSGVILSGKRNKVTQCHIESCDYAATYQAGVLVMRRNITDPEDGLALEISHNSFQGCARGDVQIAQAAAPRTDDERLKIQYNDFGPAAYTTPETGQLALQGSQEVEISHNWFHGVAGPTVGNIAIEYDFGARGLIIHHNVFWQGEGPVRTPPEEGSFRVGFHWWLDHGETEALVFNNTVISSPEALHADLDTSWPGFSDGWAAHNIIYARDDTATWRFTDPLNDDYTLRDNSPAVDAGTVIPGWVETFEGSAPDLGAYERGVTPWTAGAGWSLQPRGYPPNGAVAHGGLAQQRRLGQRFGLRVMPGRLVVQARPRGPLTLQLFDASGAVVARQRSISGETVVLKTTPFARGVYMVRVSTSRGMQTWKTLLR